MLETLYFILVTITDGNTATVLAPELVFQSLQECEVALSTVLAQAPIEEFFPVGAEVTVKGDCLTEDQMRGSLMELKAT